jgi:N-methylhydantoinase A
MADNRDHASDARHRVVGVDTGGTFTDVICRLDGRLVVHKLLSTPDDPSQAIQDGYQRVAGMTASDVPSDAPSAPVVHGTTVATNALLERDLADCALVVTAGFEDLLELQRQHRPKLYSLEIGKPTPLVSRERVVGARERIGPDGEVIEPLDESDISRVCNQLVVIAEEDGLESVAICLLHSYASPDHERRLSEAIAGDPRLDVHVSESHDVVGEFREYERASTTCVNAAVAPVMSTYLGRLDDRLPTDEIDILQSSGGRVEIGHARQYPVHTVLSGPAGGVVGALTAARELGESRILSLDMGGTSTDVSFCAGELSLSSSTNIDGLPIHAPVIDIHTVGAGGGSIAREDAGGGLRVGPQSAGADPGPACYGRGGTEPTVTDAHVVLGRIQPGHFLGGEMSLDLQAAQQSVGRLGETLGLGLEETALGILRVAEASMTRALKVMSIERGEDPRDMALVAFGGAGALHACRLAEQLEIPTVIVPRNPGLLSAFGMLHADYQRLARRSLLMPLGAALDDAQSLTTVIGSMVDQVTASAPYPAERFRFEMDAALRYGGQSYDIQVPVDWAKQVAAETAPSDELEDPRQAFEARHEQLYGYRADRPVELVGLRLRALVPGADPTEYTQQSAGGVECDAAGAEQAPVVFRDGEVTADVIDRRLLSDGDELEGPTIVTEYSGTTVIPPMWQAVVERGALMITT